MIAMIPMLTLSAAALLCGAALVLAFFRRMPASAVAYISIIVAALSGMVAFTSSQYWFWGVATVIALVITYAVPRESSKARRIYTVGGALAGAVIGLASGTQAAVIIGGAIGAFLGYEAYGMTPAGRKELRPRGSVDEFAALALPAVVNFSMVMIIFAQLLEVQ